MKAKFSRLPRPSSLALAVAVTALVIGLYLVRVPFLDSVELRAYDLRFLHRGWLPTQGKVALAVVDEGSLEELGRWQSWPRSWMAKLVDALDAAGAAVIGFDIGFFEPETAAGRGHDDRLLAESIARARAKVILGYFFRMDESLATEPENPLAARREAEALSGSRYQMVRSQSGAAGKPPLISAGPACVNLAELNQAADASGYFNIIPDPDGTIRSVPLVLERSGGYYAPLSLRLLALYLEAPLSLNLGPYGVESVQVGRRRIPTDEAGRMLINYRGPGRTFPHYSVSDILAGRLPEGALSGKMVLVGTTAPGIYDAMVTPISHIFPGLEVHANVIDNILAGDHLSRLNWLIVLDLVATLALGLAIGLMVPRLRPLLGAGAAVGLLGGYFLCGQLLFSRAGIVVNLVYPSLNLALCYTTISVYNYVVEEREKRKVKKTFSYYLSAAVINEMLKRPEKLRLGGEKKELSVLFADIRNFTSFSERLPPEDLVAFLNDYLTRMTEMVFAHDGLLDKYIGDAIMAVFGAPLPQDDHALRACNCALGMVEALQANQARWREFGLEAVNIGVGINTGQMVVGNLGSSRRFDYTVVGDAVNLSSRLEGINKVYGTRIVISESTYAQVRGEFLCRELDLVRVKGKSQPIAIYELISRAPGSLDEQALVESFQAALRSYRAKDWAKAEAMLAKAAAIRRDDGAVRLLRERLAELKRCPPEEGWDGCFTMRHK